MRDLLSQPEIDAALADSIPEWDVCEGLLVRSVTAATYAEGMRLITKVAASAAHIDHHPDIDVRWTTLTFRLVTHSAGGLTEMDVRLASLIDSML